MVLPSIELLIKASAIDANRKGGCLFCQEYFMELFLMAELQRVSLRITLVDTLRPPEDFRLKFGTPHPPILINLGIKGLLFPILPPQDPILIRLMP